jgi:hypothetical protein
VIGTDTVHSFSRPFKFSRPGTDNDTLSEALRLTDPPGALRRGQIIQYDVGTGLKFDGGLYGNENPDSDLYHRVGIF